MAAISKSWVTIADAAVDPESPLDATLMTGIRDNLVHLREWLGASFFAGAVQDHSHDGSDSFLIRIGPNAVRNGSFEDGEGSWTFTDFTGGSHAISVGTRHHGQRSISLTSTVLANGGGQAVSNEFVPHGVQDLIVSAWRSASGANISSRLEVIWYDATQAQISTVNLINDTNTPTSATRTRHRVTAPANTRFFKLRVTGGVPAAGASTGTIFWDGISASEWSISTELIEAGQVQQANIGSAQVGQGQLKTTTASGSVTYISAGATYTLTGGTYSWYTWGAQQTGGAICVFGAGNTAAGVLGVRDTTGSDNESFFVDERFVQASPPYNLGHGDIPLFAYLMVDAGGAVRSSSVSTEPTWAYNGPTDIRPERLVGDRAFRRYRELNGQRLEEALRDRETMRRFVAGEIQAELVEREITHAIKNRDMNVAPHPWHNSPVPAGCTVVLLDPTSGLVDRLGRMASEDHARTVRELIEQDFIEFDNTPLPINCPAGVMPVAARLK